MAFDSAYIAAICGELREKTVGARIEKIYQPTKDELVFVVRGKAYSGKFYMYFGGTPRAYLTDEEFQNPQQPSNFCMFLRKHLQGGKIIDVQQPHFDRVFEIEIENMDELLDLQKKRAVIELTGAASNFILIGENGIVLDALKRTELSENKRCVLPGLKYQSPSAGGRTDPFDGIEGREYHGAAFEYITGNFSGFSPLAAREIAFRCGDGDPREELTRFISRIKNGEFELAMYMDESGRPAEFSAYTLLQYGAKYSQKKYDSASAMAAEFFSQKSTLGRSSQKKSELQKQVKQLVAKAEKKLALQLSDYENSLERDKYRVYGELLQANFHLAEKGQPCVIVENYYNEMRPEKIPLDPKKSAKQNATDYFKRFQKAKTAEKMLGEQIEKTKAALQYFESVAAALETCESENDLEEIRRELVSGGHAKKGKQGKQKPPASKFAVFVSSDGFPILAGKNNIQNEEIYSKIADKNDIWLHAQNIAGSHVVISCEGEEVPDRTLYEAAVIAATMSSGKNAGKLPIQYTKIKMLKKPAGSPPGYVTMKSYNTLIAAGDEELLNKLRK